MLGQEIYAERARAMRAYVRAGVVGIAIVGVAAGVTAAIWIDRSGIRAVGASGDVHLWVRPFEDDDVKPGETGSTWGEGLLNLELAGAVLPDETYSLQVDVYNSGSTDVVVDFAAALGHGAPAWPEFSDALSSTSGLTTLPADSKTTYTIELDTAGLPGEYHGEGFEIVASFSGEIAAVPEQLLGETTPWTRRTSARMVRGKGPHACGCS